MTHTITDNHGTIVSGVKVVPLGESLINQPGSNSESAGSSASSSTPSSSPAASATDTTGSAAPTASAKSAGARFAQGESTPFLLGVSVAVVASVIAGLLG